MKNICIKRITKDIREIQSSALEGIGIIQQDINDIMNYIVNIKILSGIYKNICFQLKLTFNSEYPSHPPKILIFPNQKYKYFRHHHIFDTGFGYQKFCFDLLDNDFLSTNEEHTGWNPSYTISSLLIQVQNFLADPDLFEGYLPSKEQIEYIFEEMKNYQSEFTDLEGNKVSHTWENPYPKFGKEMNNEKEKNNEIEKNKEEINLIEIKENLTCFFLKSNYIDDPNIILGYPIVQTRTKNDLIEIYPIPQLLTYEAFVNQIGKDDKKLDFYFSIKFKSANNEFYNYWIPIYIDKNHFEKNKQTILNSFSIIKYGASGLKMYDFKIEHIFEILPIVLNKMIIGFLNNKTTLSEAFIRCYFQYILLLTKLIKIYNNEFNDYMNYIIKKIEKNKFTIDKNIINDIGNFAVNLLFSNFKVDQKLWNVFVEEFIIRKNVWLFHGEEESEETKKLLYSFFKANFYNLSYNTKNENKIIEKEKIDEFVNSLKKKKIYNKFISLILKDEVINKKIKHKKKGKNNETIELDLDNEMKKEILKKKFEKNPDLIFNGAAKETIAKCMILIFKNNIDLNSFIYLCDLKLNYFDQNLFCNYSNSIELILKNLKNEQTQTLLKFGFNSHRGTKLLIITWIAKNKINDKNFLEKLEKNYGVLLNEDVKEIMNEIKIKLKEINSYSKLFEFIGCTLLNDNYKEIDLYKICYKKAIEKGYFKISHKKTVNKK